jgi:hypothetical protein
MKRIKLSFLTTVCFVMALAVFTACSKNDDQPSTPSNNNGAVVKPKPNWTDSFARKWIVKKATYNSKEDQSSVGMQYEFKKDGTYDFDNGRFLGTWKFMDSTYKTMLLDENSTSIGKSVWTTTVFTSKNITVDYTSPITGGKVHWDMESK